MSLISLGGVGVDFGATEIFRDISFTIAPGDRWAARFAEDTQLYQIITVDGDELRYEARTATNRLYDAFTLRKRAGRANQLVEALPPENRRPPAAR